MISKTNFQTLEPPDGGKSIVVQEVDKLIVRMQNADREGIFISGKLIDKIKEFVRRNSLNLYDGEKNILVCCYSCLRAHIMKTSKELGLSPEIIAYLGDLLTGEIGHNGYYLDSKKIIKIS